MMEMIRLRAGQVLLGFRQAGMVAANRRRKRHQEQETVTFDEFMAAWAANHP